MTSQSRQKESSALEPPAFARQKVLLIDDSDSIHELVKFRLKYDAVDVISACDGATGIGISSTLRPDLILLDVDMPDMNGFEVCRRLKENPGTSHIPVVFITSEATTEQKVRGLALGAVDYVTKPFDAVELRARVHASLRGKHTHDRMASHVMVDDLTELWNSAYLDRQLIISAIEAKRFQRSLSCIVFDVDHLGSINENHGERSGDELLRVLARRIVGQCRAEDIASRLGGGTFAILSRNTSTEQATLFAHRLWSTLASRPIIHREASINFKCTFGVASLQTEANSNPLEEARQAMKRAKGIGGARLAVASQSKSDETRRKQVA